MSVLRSTWRSRRALPMANKVVAAVVVLCGVVGMAAYAAGAAYAIGVYRVGSQAAAACDPLGNDTNSSKLIVPAIEGQTTSRYTCLAVQSSSEAVALVLVTCAYLLLVG